VPYVTAVHLPGPYRLNAYRAQLVSLYTNTAIVTPYRGAGRPQATFAMERTMDAIADRLGRDRTTVREANFISPDDLPYDRDLAFIDGRPISYDSGDFPESMRQLKKLIDWDGFAGRRAAARTQGRRVGIGIACCVESTGTGPYEGGHVQVDTDGHVRAATGLTTQGQGHHTTFAQIVGHELGVPIDAVTVTTGDTRRFARSMGTFNSRAAVTAGNALALAARSVRAKALYVAGDALQVSPEDLEIANGFVRLKTDPAVALPLATIAALADPVRRPYEAAARAAARFTRPADPSVPPLARGEQPGLTHTTYFSPVRPTFSHSMHAAIVETDPDTAEIRILRYCVVHDCGTVINPGIVEGQVVGGVAQGIAGALYERIGYDHAGRLHTSSLTDFLVPYATEIPTVEIHHGTTPSPLNPLGVKGAGESGVIPVAAVLASAIEDAEGLRIDRIPLSPNDLFHLRARSKE
jgi:carbon-monoxide dehydrogenase large subunit